MRNDHTCHARHGLPRSQRLETIRGGGLMGIKMMVEILDHWQDAGLTVGERSDLLVLAENANDGTRLTFGPVHEEYILRRAGKTAESWRVAISRLMKKKVLEFASRDGRELRGRTGQYAVYRLPELCPKPPHSGYKGHCTKPASTGSEGYQRANAPEGAAREGYQAANAEGYLRANAVDGEGYQADTEWVSSQVTPTPPVSSFKIPSDTPSSPVAEDVTEGPAETGPSEDGGGGDSSSRKTAKAITAALDYQGTVPGKKQLETITVRLVAAFAAGWTIEGLAGRLDLGTFRPNSPAALYAHRLDPDELGDPPVPAAPQARSGGRSGARKEPLPTEAYAGVTVGSLLFGERRDTADGGMWERAMQRAQQKTAAMAGGGGHRPYSNDVWCRPADPAAAALIPHCGDLDCDPSTRIKDYEDEKGFKFAQNCGTCHPDMLGL